MKPQQIVSHDVWLQERKKLLAQEKAITGELDKLASNRRALPWVKIDSVYDFDTTEGKKSLVDLFGAQNQLIVYHFMFGPEWEEGCKSCSFWADNFNGVDPHLRSQDIAFVAVSRAPLEKLVSFKKRMGWKFNWVSSFSNSFNADFDVSFGSDHKSEDPVTYNFQDNAHYPMDEAHGTSVFAKDDEGFIYRTYSTYGRGLDATNCAYSYIDLTPKGRIEDPNFTMSWLRHHDDY